jgi:pimeloyl-ACP methyl ester carboxylesterase
LSYGTHQGALHREDLDLRSFLDLGDGIRIEYGIVDSIGPPRGDLVMLHEGLGSVDLWKDFPQRLAERTGWRIVLYSRPGYGRSSAVRLPRTPQYIHEEAARLPAVLERLQVHCPVLFGHSDGASIALIYAASQPRIKGLVLLAPHVQVELLTLSSIESARVAYETTDLRSRLGRFHDDVDHTFRGWNDIWLAPEFRDWNIEALLATIEVPIVAIQGVDDEYGTLEQLYRIKHALPGTGVHELGNCRHSPRRDRPDEVLSLTAEFLNRLEMRATALEARYDMPESSVQQVDFKSLVSRVTAAIHGRTLDVTLESDLNQLYPAGSPMLEDIESACRDAIQAGWMCSREGGGIRYGRVIKPGAETHGFSVDVVDMTNLVGPHHRHPSGEIDLVMPQNSGAQFDHRAARWAVYPPGSAHRPTVSGGRAWVLYLLPGGAIEFTGDS